MAKMKTKLEKQIREFVERFYKEDQEIVQQTKLYLETAEYGRLVSLMEKVERNHRRNVGVLHFELLGFSYQLFGESLLDTEYEKCLEQYENMLATFEKGMHFATGSGEGWAFRKLYDRAQSRLRRIKKQKGF